MCLFNGIGWQKDIKRMTLLARSYLSAKQRHNSIYGEMSPLHGHDMYLMRKQDLGGFLVNLTANTLY